jgi:redox-sensitive bicupin YhaK (pirin superfamily)
MSEALLIGGRADTLEGHPIVRLLPSARCRSVGPFVFFDHMLEHRYAAGQGMNINQHPHIGLCTLTYLFEGRLLHKDSLGSEQIVSPGDVSWMTAGHGVAHVERTPADALATGSSLHGLQVWLALPEDREECAPAYSHHAAESLPVSDSLGVWIRLVAGSGFCMQSPVPVASPTLYADLRLVAGATLSIGAEHPERALYILEGDAMLDDQVLPPRQLAILEEGREYSLSGCSEVKAVMIGGQPLGPRRMDWNFVATDPSRLASARARWSAGDWPQVPGETQRIEIPAPRPRQTP